MIDAAAGPQVVSGLLISEKHWILKILLITTQSQIQITFMDKSGYYQLCLVYQLHHSLNKNGLTIVIHALLTLFISFQYL